MIDSHEMGFSFEGRLRNGRLMGAIRQAAMETQLVLVRAKLQSRFQAVSFCSPCFAQRRRSMLNRCFAEMRCTPVRMRDPAPRQFHRRGWKFPTGDRVISSAAFEDSVIYFG